jgi:hypothetical protein
MLKKYSNVLKNRDFALLWSGLTISQLGDGLSFVALIWFIYELTDSALAIGLFLMFYTAPTIIGGLIAGVLLDRFDKRKVMILDNLVRALAIGVLPLLHYLGVLELWHIYAVGLVFGGLMMISLAGGPALVPALIRKEDLNTANALESISWSLGDIIGRAAAGLLIGIIGAPNVLILDMLTFLIFVINLSFMRVPSSQNASDIGAQSTNTPSVRLRDGFKFLLTNRLIFAITAAFLVLNIGAGSLGVILPLYADKVLLAGAMGFGILTASISVGQLVSSLWAGGVTWKYPLGHSIAVAVIFTGISFSMLLITPNLIFASLALLGFGFFIAPCNIWAQTIRMRLIPEELRGRVFSILRTVIRSTLPLSSSLFGLVIPLIGIMSAVGAAALLIGLPGILALATRAFAEDEEPTPISEGN